MYPNSQWDSAEEEGRYTYAPVAPTPAEPYDPWKAAGQQPPPTTQARPGYYWRQLPDGSWAETPNGGVTPPTTGKLPEPPPPPPPTWNGGDDGDWGFLNEQFTRTPPSWMAGPSFVPPTFVTPPPFSYQKYEAPTTDSIYADPSYEFRKGEGLKALGQHRASQGTYLTGGTLKDFINYNQNAASQEYSNIFDRSVQAHNTGLQQALGTYGVNYGVQRDAYDRLYEGNKATFEGQQRENALMNQREFDNFLADFDIFRDNKKRVRDNLFDAADYS